MIEPMVTPIVNPNFIKNPPDNSMGRTFELIVGIIWQEGACPVLTLFLPE